jgi:hypothetical protein
VCTASNTGGHGSNRKPAGTDRTGMHIGKWRVGDMNSVLVNPANNARSSTSRCCETAHLRRRSDYLFCTGDAEPVHMNGFVRLARIGRKNSSVYVCIYTAELWGSCWSITCQLSRVVLFVTPLY